MKKKLLFWFGNDYTHLCLSYVLKQKLDCELYAIVDVSERPKKFFEKQNIIDFKKIWFLHDSIQKQSKKPDFEYLKKFEKKYNINLWKLVLNERIFLYNDFHNFTYDEILNIVEQVCHFFESVIDEIKPDFFLTKLPGFHHLEIFYQMCKNIGIHVLMLNLSTFGKSCIITQNPSKLDDFYEISNKSETNFDELQKQLSEFDLSNQIKNKVIKPGTDKSSQFSSALEYFLHSDQKNLETHYNYYGRTRFKVFRYYLNSFLKTKYRKSFIDKSLKKTLSIDYPFVYFPLHIGIERATLITAPFFVNQIEVIRTISKSIPINFKLYVKEHPAQVTRDWRSISYYKELMKIPNVEILHPDVSKKPIYEKCSLVITIAGSSGFEGLFYGKPAITFSTLNYSSLPFVFQVQHLDDLPSLILKALDTKVDPLVVSNYIELLKKNSSEFDWVDFNTKIKNEFFYGGNLIDVEISESKMHSFLKKNFSILEILADDHIKKIIPNKN